MWIKFRQYIESVDPWMPKQDSVWKLMEGISGSKVMKHSQTTAIFSFSLFMDEWNKGQRQILFSEWMKKLTKTRDKVGQRSIKCRRESSVVDLEKYERKLGWEIYSATLIPFLLLLLLISFFFLLSFYQWSAENKKTLAHGEYSLLNMETVITGVYIRVIYHRM